ncbi:hypothetical protein like AT2G37820 [Hibiscus trionum]|uniref:DC1 domain-containing protein n=1 Tax=Hibiscus trionum TaxID=183268 RepID=A0A9W7JBT5_HIBTR|nr:hypothetical protein like AT2G37820 [Hibiscus trionum]
MTTLSKQTVQHFIHCCHPLTQVSADSEFLCRGCRTPGSGTRYRCEPCDLDLHEYCADCPMELSSFMDKHSLELVGYKPDHVCDLCDDPIEGLFYRCELCDFSVHPICTQLPEYTRHGMHEDHLLRLDISVPIGCMVCKDMCLSWRYRCEVCTTFHLHLDCTLAPPCEEETTMSKTKTRSLGTPAPPQPSACPPAFGAYNCSYGYGGIPPPPQYYAQPSFPPHVHGYGGIPPPPPPQYYAQPSFPPHVHGYGGIPPPATQYFAQPSFAPHVQSYGGIHPPPQYFAQPSFAPHAHGYGTPSTYHAQTSGSQVQGQGGKVRKRMYAIVRNLILGVVCNVIAGSVLLL